MQVRYFTLMCLLLPVAFLSGKRLERMHSSVEQIELAQLYENILATETQARSDEYHELYMYYLKVIAEKKQIEQDAVKIASNYKLLTTFANAGKVPENIEDIQALASEFDKTPFGSPFIGGYIVTDPYGKGVPTWYRQTGIHYGIDLYPKGDKNIYATADGEIVEFGETENLGKYIIFRTANGYEQTYGHLSKIYWQDEDHNVTGVPLKKGTRIALMGATGKLITGPHLHYEIRMPSGNRLDPAEILAYMGNKE